MRRFYIQKCATNQLRESKIPSVIDEFKEYGKLWKNKSLHEDLWEDQESELDFSKLTLNDLPQGIRAHVDTKYTTCERCGKQALGCAGNFEAEENDTIHYGSYYRHLVLIDFFGEHICFNCLDKAGFGISGINIHSLLRYFSDLKKAIENFRNGKAFDKIWQLDYVDKWTDIWNRLEGKLRLPQAQKDEVSQTLADGAKLMVSQDYKDFTDQIDARYRAQQQAQIQQTQMRQPKKRVSQHRIVYAVFFKGDGDYDIPIISANKALVEKVFKRDAAGFLECCSNANQRIHLIEVDMAYMKDKRILALFNKYLDSDTFPVDLDKDEEALIREYKDELEGGCKYVNSLVCFYDIDAAEAAAGDPNISDNLSKQEWKDFVRDYIDGCM